MTSIPLTQELQGPAQPSVAKFSRPSVGTLSPTRKGSEMYDAVLWRLRQSLPEAAQSKSVMGFLSCASGMGVTTVAANVAARAADHGLGRVLLVDTNFSKPRLRDIFRQVRADGLADLLKGDAGLDDVAMPTPIDNLFLLSSGAVAAADSIGFDPRMAADLVQLLRERFDIVIFDLAVAVDMNRSVILAREMDANVFVLRSDALRQEQVRVALDSLSNDHVDICGTVLTRHRRYLPRWIDRFV